MFVDLINDMMDDLEQDENTGEVVVHLPRAIALEVEYESERFQTIEDLAFFLASFGYVDRESVDYQNGIDGEYAAWVAIPYAIDPDEWDLMSLEEFLTEVGIADFLSSGILPPADDRIFNYRDLTQEPMLRVASVELTNVNAELLRYLGRRPEMIHRLQPRQFEEVVASIFEPFLDCR